MTYAVKETATTPSSLAPPIRAAINVNPRFENDEKIWSTSAQPARRTGRHARIEW
jgi:hypothetical protein